MTTLRSALIVDDERDIRELLVLTLGRMGLRVDTAADIAAAHAQLNAEKYDLCLTDMRLPDGSGLDLVSHINQRHPDTPVAMITAFGNVEAAVNALKAGAFDFVTKPVDLAVLRRLVQSALGLGEQRRSQQPTAHRLIGDSTRMQQLRNTINKLARNQAPVHISGESGVGKELVARLIHELGVRSQGPFVAVNCGAIPSELMESEFFGHRKGSFTGAHADKDGLFQIANGGTLFLDEVAELPLHMQVKLLRVIQEKTVRAVGAPNESPVDVRILSATHKNLAKLVEEGKFRHDLFYRINVIELPVPALRERPEDIPLIAQAVLQRLTAEFGEPISPLSSAAIDALRQYPFPGNVRELENILERAVALCEGEQIEPVDLNLPGRTEAPTELSALAENIDSTMVGWVSLPGHNPTDNLTSTSVGLRAANPTYALPDTMEQIERDTIQQALKACRYNKTKAAAYLGITFRALRYKIEKLGME